MNFQLLDTVVLLADLPEEELHKGAIGAIVEVLDAENGMFLVEFADPNGATFAMVELPAEKLMRVFYEPVELAA